MDTRIGNRVEYVPKLVRHNETSLLLMIAVLIDHIAVTVTVGGAFVLRCSLPLSSCRGFVIQVGAKVATFPRSTDTSQVV